MNSRERELAAIRHQIPDRIPVDAIAIEIQPELAQFMSVGEDAVMEALGTDGRVILAPYAGLPGETLNYADELLRRPECVYLAPHLGYMPKPSTDVTYTEWGTPNTGDYGTARPYPLAKATTLAEIERYNWPPAARYDYAWAGKMAREFCGSYAIRGPYWKPLFCQVCDMFGMEDAMVRMLTEPILFEAALEQVFNHTYEYCRRFVEACGDALHIFYLGDDFATQRGMMISPKCWRQFLKPRYARLFELGKRAGKFVWFHACGDITAVLPDLIDIGMDVWETVQLHTLPLSAVELKHEYGKHITFFGAISTQRLPFNSPDGVRAEVVRVIEALGKGGGYICGPDHHIKPDVSPANAVALFAAARSFRREGYTREEAQP